MATTIVEAPSVTSGPGVLAQLEDEQLVSAIRDGHEAAFEVFYDRHHNGVLSFCRHMLGSQEDAEDAVQQTFLATYKQAQDASPPEHPRAWLYTVARNRCLTTIRARRESSTEVVEPATEGLAEEVERRQELRELLGDLGRLPEDQRVALLLFELGALSQAEIAETIGCPPAKVKALVYQARTTLAHRAEARNARCSEVREQLATLRGGALNNRAIKHHLDICDGCSEFLDEVRRQRRRFALILPVIPLAASHGGVLSALGIGAGASSHAAAASHGGRWVAYAARPRVAVIAALTAGAAAAGVTIMASGGHHRATAEHVVPPAQAAAPVTHVAAKTRAPVVHRAAKHQAKPGAARASAHHRASAVVVRQPTRHDVVAPAPRSPAGTPPAPPKRGPVHRAPSGHSAPPASPPQGNGSPPASKPSNPPAAAPPPTTTGTPPPAPPPSSDCKPNGQGGGHAWGHCKGPDGLPPPAEKHK